MLLFPQRLSGFDHHVGHFWPRSMTSESSHAPCLQCWGDLASPRGRWGGQRHDRGQILDDANPY